MDIKKLMKKNLHYETNWLAKSIKGNEEPQKMEVAEVSKSVDATKSMGVKGKSIMQRQEDFRNCEELIKKLSQDLMQEKLQPTYPKLSLDGPKSTLPSTVTYRPDISLKVEKTSLGLADRQKKNEMLFSYFNNKKSLK